jgi:hypothetical protein
MTSVPHGFDLGDLPAYPLAVLGQFGVVFH